MEKYCKKFDFVKFMKLGLCPALFVFTLNFSPLIAQDEDINSADNKAYSNFDFIAGTKTIFFEDFTQGISKWKVIDNEPSDEFESPGVKQMLESQMNWFKIPRRGVFYPANLNVLPENFTLEFDMWADAEKMSEMESGLIVSIVGSKVIKDEYSTAFDENPQIQLDIHPSEELLYCQATKENFDGERLLDRRDIIGGWKKNKIHRISISKIGSHVKVYIGEKKFLDLPNGLPVKTPYTLIFASNMWGDGLYITNLKIAESPTQKPELKADQKFVTSAIYFNVNSAVIKPESWPALKLAAELIKANSGKIQIIGHTDSDGKETDNLTLSEKRAEAVREFLIKNYGIDSERLLIGGKGESEPVDTNNTPEGKANNRRVEFILM